MRASVDWRQREVTLTMNVSEFVETVEWLELIDPDDGCTREWRAALDRIAPVASEEDEATERLT